MQVNGVPSTAPSYRGLSVVMLLICVSFLLWWLLAVGHIIVQNARRARKGLPAITGFDSRLVPTGDPGGTGSSTDGPAATTSTSTSQAVLSSALFSVRNPLHKPASPRSAVPALPPRSTTAAASREASRLVRVASARVGSALTPAASSSSPQAVESTGDFLHTPRAPPAPPALPPPPPGDATLP